MLPKKGKSADEILQELRNLASMDYDPQSGRMWGHVYNAGLDELLELARKAMLPYLDKTMLDFTTYPSILKLENDIVAMTASLLNGDENVVGNFTYGGTESIMLAMKSARDVFWDEKGKSVVPEMVLPFTAHPAFLKAAEYLGFRVVQTAIDEDFRADVDAINEAVTNKTAVIVGSAPNYPFGVVDDIKSMAEIAEDKNVWFHVDACMGAFILPFMRKLGENVPDFDFSVEGVTSISADIHKYGYAPRGASVVLYRNSKFRRIFVKANWPGYPLVNTAVLSTRSAAPLAAAWAVMNFLGEEGYLEMTRKVLEVRKKLEQELPKMGFEILGKPDAGLLAFSSQRYNVFRVAKLMAAKGWYIQAQPGSAHLGFPKSIHLTIIPIHAELIDSFLGDLKAVTENPEVEGKLEIDLSDLSSLLASIEVSSEKLPDMELINELIHSLPPETVENMLRYFVNEYIFRPG